MVSSGLRVTLLPLAFVLLITVTAPTHAVGAVGIVHDSPDATDATRMTTLDTEMSEAVLPETTNNSSTVQHSNPDETNERGETADLQRWFAGQLSANLENSTTKLEAGEYEQARSILGDEYGETLGKYVDLAGETSGDEDDRISKEFELAQERQQEYVSAVSEYRTKQEEYREAKQNGNETQARELARELKRLQNQANQTGANLTASYSTLGNRTDGNFTSALRTTDSITQNISTTQLAIENETFIRTSLRVEVQPNTVSFHDPVRLTGRLTADNGSTLADRRIAVQFGPQTVRTRTNDDGTFATTIRPTLVALGNQSITVKYVPQYASVYLGTTESVSVNVSQVTPTVSLTQVTPTVQFGETVVVEGGVHAGNVSAEEVPVRVTVGKQVLGTTRTDANGTVRFETALPATLPEGDRQLDVSVPLTNRALASASSVRTITITPTATQLTIERNRTASEGVRLTGTLRTSTGNRVPEQTVVLRVDNRTIGTVMTNENGHYAVTVNRSTLAPDVVTDAVTVSAIYEGTANLNTSLEQTEIQLEGDGPVGENRGGLWTLLRDSLWPLVLGVGGFGVLGVLVLRRFDLLGRPTATEAEPATVEAEGESSSSTDDTVSTDTGRSLLARATTQLSNGNDDYAVRAAYAAARHRVTALPDSEAENVEMRTHWEFYQWCQNSDAVTTEQLAAVEELTEAFEHTRYSPGAVPTDVASRAVRTATDFLSNADVEAGADGEAVTEGESGIDGVSETDAEAKADAEARPNAEAKADAKSKVGPDTEMK